MGGHQTVYHRTPKYHHVSVLAQGHITPITASNSLTQQFISIVSSIIAVLVSLPY